MADPVDVLELDPGLTAVHAVDGEPHGGDMAGVDDTLDGLARQWRQFLQASLFHQTAVDGRSGGDCGVSPRRRRVCPRRGHRGDQGALRGGRRPAWGNCSQPWILATAITTTNPYVGADMALTKGWCLRELGNEEAAKTAFRAATVHGVALEAAREALDDPTYRLVITDAETIASRTDPWEALHRLPHHDVQMGCGTAATDDRVAT